MPVNPSKMINCNACGKFVSPMSAARCTRCTMSYHRACVNIPGSAEIVSDWKCPSCKLKMPKGDKTATPVKGISGDYVQVGILAESGRTTEVRTSDDSGDGAGGERSGTVCSSPHMAETQLGIEIRDEIRALHSHFALLREDFNKLIVSVESTNKRLDGLESRIQALEARPSNGEGDCKKHTELEQTVLRLRRDLNDRDQELLSSDLEISNLPEDPGENLIHTVALLSSKIGSPVDERDIVFVERVGARVLPGAVAGRARSRRVMVRLARRGLRDDLLRAARVRRNTTTADLDMPAPSVQSGFRRGRSTATALLDVTDAVLSAQDHGMGTILVLLDYSRAFDSINHSLLLSKLAYYGVDAASVQWFRSYLESRRQVVEIKRNDGTAARSVCSPVLRGVPQGSVIGPLLYILYSADVVESIRDCKFHLYADDLQIYIHFHPRDTASTLY